jgi:hypothetical protein
MSVSQVETSSITTIRRWKSCTNVAVSPWRSMQKIGGYFQFVGVYWLSHQVHPSVRTGISFYHNTTVTPTWCNWLTPLIRLFSASTFLPTGNIASSSSTILRVFTGCKPYRGRNVHCVQTVLEPPSQWVPGLLPWQKSGKCNWRINRVFFQFHIRLYMIKDENNFILITFPFYLEVIFFKCTVIHAHTYSKLGDCLIN